MARHARMCVTFGLNAPPPPPPPPSAAAATTTFLLLQLIYAVAPRPGLTAVHSSFSARPVTPAPLPSVAPVAKPPSTFPQTVLNPQAATAPPPPPPSYQMAVPALVPPASAAPAVQTPGTFAPIIEPQPSNVADSVSKPQSAPRGNSLFERMLFGADRQPLRAAATATATAIATAAAEERRQGEEDKENAAPRGRSREHAGGSGEAQPPANRRRQARGEEFEEGGAGGEGEVPVLESKEECSSLIVIVV